jgi:hypothetical protein
MGLQEDVWNLVHFYLRTSLQLLFIYAATDKLVMMELKIGSVAYPKPRFRAVADIPRALANHGKNWYTE